MSILSAKCDQPDLQYFKLLITKVWYFKLPITKVCYFKLLITKVCYFKLPITKVCYFKLLFTKVCYFKLLFTKVTYYHAILSYLLPNYAIFSIRSWTKIIILVVLICTLFVQYPHWPLDHHTSSQISLHSKDDLHKLGHIYTSHTNFFLLPLTLANRWDISFDPRPPSHCCNSSKI